MYLGIVFSKLARRKYFTEEQITSTRLKRCLTVFDLVLLGIGSTLGLGIYVLAGEVAKETAGPAVTISFFIAAVASVFAGLCYAEFAALLPKAGSSYTYSYVTVGEFLAFIIGWDLVINYVIGSAGVARGYSGYIDTLFNHEIRNYFNKTLPMQVEHLSQYPDFLAFGIVLFLTVLLSFGVKESATVNGIFTGINLIIVAFVIICGAMQADFHNWALSKNEVPSDAGEGGFFPFGISGMLKGAATCFFGYIGFDCLATTGEEVKNPQRAIPLSILIALLFIFLAYFGISTVTTLMIPYYMQDPDAPLPHAFEKVGWPAAKWIITVGALAGLSTSLLGAMFPLPRVIYSMASDGLIFRFLANIHPRFKTPLIATLISGTFTGVLAAVFNLDELIDMMSFATLLSYTLVAFTIIIIRYRDENEFLVDPIAEERTEPIARFQPITCWSFTKQYVNYKRISNPTKLTAWIVKLNIIIIVIVLLIFDGCLVFLDSNSFVKNLWILGPLVVSFLILVMAVISITTQPQTRRVISFKVPAVPFIPVFSMFINIFLLLKLSLDIWIRFWVGMIAGLLIYIFYGFWESSEEYHQQGRIPPNEDETVGNVSVFYGCFCTRLSRKKRDQVENEDQTVNDQTTEEKET